MARRRQNKAKRSLASLPKGLPQRKRGVASVENPFEVSSRQKRTKHEVHNRSTSSTKQTTKQTALQRSIQRRQAQLQHSLSTQKKANAFVDRRIGEYDGTASSEHKMLARLVKERSRRSKRSAKYSLNEEEEELTHKGRLIQDFNNLDSIILSDDEEEGNLDAVDTEFHFGGGSLNQSSNPYGPSGGGDTSMTQLYSQRKTELDDLIARRKILKAERVKSKEEQEEAFGNMDESFGEIASMLQFRDKTKERKLREDRKASGQLDKEEQEMADWDKEMKTYLFERRVKATDRTKTPEEIAKEEAERLHELETRRLARMNGDFDEDDLMDISDDEASNKYKKKKEPKKPMQQRNPDELDDSDNEDNDEMEVKFTADGLVYMDKDGNSVRKVGEEDGDESDSDSSSSHGDDSSSDSEAEGDEQGHVLAVGAKVKGNYRVKEQFEEQSAWYDGVVTAVNKQRDGSVTYDVTYDDGDFEEGMEPENVRPVEKTAEEREKEQSEQSNELLTKRKRQKAKDKAR